MSLPAYQIPLDFNEPVAHHSILHRTPHGAVLVWESLASSGNRWTKIKPGDAPADVAALLTKLSGQQDSYMTVNEFDGWRLVRLLRSLRACYVDIDLGRAAERHDLDAALEQLRDARLPTPSLAVFSGRGLHLYWLLTPTPAKALPVWQRVQDAILDELANFGADAACRDCTRVLRLTGTVNSKTGAVVRGLVLDGQPWTLHSLADEVLGHRPAKPAAVRSFEAAKVKRGDKPSAGGSIYSRWHLVMQDLHRIGQYWKPHGGIPEGNRDKFLFLSAVSLSWFSAPDAIDEEVRDMARMYVSGMSISDIGKAAQESYERAVKARAGEKIMYAGRLQDPRYLFKRETLWGWLREVAQPIAGDLRAILTDATAAARKKDRDSARYADHYTGAGVRASNEQKRATARLLAAQGKPQTAIAAELGVSQQSVSKWLRSTDTTKSAL